MSELKTCFKKVDYDLGGLLHYIDIGDIGLPDIQRPFVWSNAKVRDLFDSMYRGFPIGYLLFWENGAGNGAKQIGLDRKQHATASRLIVDGQQRLTSLYAVFRGKKVMDEDYRERQIEVAFRPRDGKFEVADAAIRRDPEWIPNISEIWASGKSSYQLVRGFLKQLEAKGPLTPEAEDRLSHNLDRLFDLQKYPFTALEIAPTVDEEQVADIFVRINSEGVRLNQADFILTLMSVFWDEGRTEVERFCRQSRQAPSPGAPPSSFNHFIQPDPDQMLRVAVALGFQRGRLKSVYHVLRGKDLDTGEFSTKRRDQQFKILREAQTEVLNLTHWHQFLSCLIGSGFRSGEMISSQTALLYAYAFYLAGRKRFRLAEHQLQRLVGRWFFASSLTGRYTNSPESVMDGDLNRLKIVREATGFVRLLEETMETELTNDFWNVTLVANLDSSSARNPELFAYVAAQNCLGAPVLFSHKHLSHLIDPALRARKKALERHHLFPRAWLESQGIEDLKEINQLANFALLEWPENIDISDAPPAEYVPQVRPRFSAQEWKRMHEHHALPEDWHLMSYNTFLTERRKLMAATIRRGFESLNAFASDSTPPPSNAVMSAEATESWKAALASATCAESNEPAESSIDGADEGEQAPSPSSELRRKYWETFLKHLANGKNIFEIPQVTDGRQLRFRPPLTGARPWAWISVKHRTIGVGVTFYGKQGRPMFSRLHKHTDIVNRELGADTYWHDDEDRNWAYFEIFKRDTDPALESAWPEQHVWLEQKLQIIFQRILPILNAG